MDDTGIRELLRRIRTGDRAARAELISLLGDEDRFGSAVRRIAHSVLARNPPARQLADSHDIMQSALLDAYRKLSDFRGENEGSLFAWIKTIIRTKVGRAARKNARPVAVEAEDPDPLGHLIDDELIDSLRSAVLRLPLHERLVVELKLRGCRSAKTGEYLGLKPETVRKREQRAVAKLRLMLEG